MNLKIFGPRSASFSKKLECRSNGVFKRWPVNKYSATRPFVYKSRFGSGDKKCPSDYHVQQALIAVRTGSRGPKHLRMLTDAIKKYAFDRL